MNTIARLTEAQNHRCAYCGHHMITYRTAYYQAVPRNLRTKDHVEPRSYGGPTVRDNLIAACLQCNNLRGNIDAVAFFNILRKRFKRDPTLRARWHELSRAELREITEHCQAVHERQLYGLARRSVEYAFRHYALMQVRRLR